MGKKDKKPSVPRKHRPRITQADRYALEALDHLLASEREMEAKYALPFRMPHNIATTLHECTRCHHPIVMLIFGDSAKDVAGLQAYARLMQDVIQQHNLPTYILAPPADLTAPDDPALFLKVWPTEEAARRITPDQWDQIIDAMSSTHCPDELAEAPRVR